MAAWQIRDSPAADDSVRPWRLVRFVPFFLWSSLLGSWEVAWRALHWHLPISTGIQTYNLRLPPKSSARVFFANCISLFPGTLTVAWIGDELEVHFLVNCPASTASVRKLEMQVAYLFGHAIPAHNEEPTS
jgi:multisubunit Na+/H+ antiporter MnhE subunit